MTQAVDPKVLMTTQLSPHFYHHGKHLPTDPRRRRDVWGRDPHSTYGLSLDSQLTPGNINENRLLTFKATEIWTVSLNSIIVAVINCYSPGLA